MSIGVIPECWSGSPNPLHTFGTVIENQKAPFFIKGGRGVSNSNSTATLLPSPEDHHIAHSFEDASGTNRES